MPRCSNCNYPYSLRKLVGGRCPNCKEKVTLVVRPDPRIAMAIKRQPFNDVLIDAATRSGSGRASSGKTNDKELDLTH